MTYIPYSRQSISEDDIAAVVSVLRSDFLTQGPVLQAFEQAFASAHEVPHAVAVSNATAGLHLACQALGVGPGSRVWTSPNSFVASANCARYCGAEIDFVDIDAASRNMSVQALRDKLRTAQASGRLPDVVIPVDFAGWAGSVASSFVAGPASAPASTREACRSIVSVTGLDGVRERAAMSSA